MKKFSFLKIIAVVLVFINMLFAETVVPSTVSLPIGHPQLGVGYDHSGGVTFDGKLYMFGDNSSYELGDGTTTSLATPTQIGSDTNWYHVNPGREHTIALKQNGTIYSWGTDQYSNGALGTGSNNSPNITQIGVDSDWVHITTGYYHTLALKSDGTLWGWGQNSNGQLGNSSTTDVSTPTQIGSETWLDVSTGFGGQTIAIKSDGTLWGWGNNNQGQVGNNTQTNVNSPVQISMDTDWKKVVAGGYHSFAQKSDGKVYAWGLNSSNQLGASIGNPIKVPTLISSLENAIDIGPGAYNTYFVKSDGTLWKNIGQIGSDTDWLRVKTGTSADSIGLKRDYTLWNIGLSSPTKYSSWQSSTRDLYVKSNGGVVQFDGDDTFINSGLTSLEGDFTIEAWINLGTPDVSTDDFFIASKHTSDGSSNSLAEFFLYVQDYDKLKIGMGDGTTSITASSTNSIPSSQWSHIAATYDSSTLSVKLFINGVEETLSGTSTLSSSRITGSLPLQIGRYYNGGYGFAKGMIDEIRIWNTSRTAEEIAENYNKQLSGSESGLVAYYNFDERAGYTVYDLTSNANDGTINGDVKRINFLGNGLSFDGTDDAIQITSDPSIEFSGDDDFSISTWVKTDSTETQTFIEKIIDSGSGPFVIWLQMIDGIVDFHTGENGVGWESLLSTTPVNDGTWHHITVTKEGNTKTIYIDGIEENSIEATMGGTANTAVWNIGSIRRDSAQYFNGNMAEVSVWRKALKADEIKKLMYNVIDITDTNLAGYWPLNDGGDTGIVNDLSLNGNDGNITGATWIDNAPTIYGNTIYTSEDILTSQTLTIDNNTTDILSYAYNGTQPSEIQYLNADLGNFTYVKDSSGNYSLDFAGIDNGATFYQSIDVKVYETPFIDIVINLNGLDVSDHNVTSITLIGNDGNTTLNGSVDTWSGTILKGDYKIAFETDDGIVWWQDNDGFINQDSSYYINMNNSTTYTYNVTPYYWEKIPEIVNILSSQEDWKQSLNNFLYWDSSITQNNSGSYESVSINKIAGNLSAFEIYQSSESETYHEISMQIELTNFSENAYAGIYLYDIYGSYVALLFNETFAYALSEHYEGAYDNEGIILEYDDTKPLSYTKLNLNIWMFNGSVYFNITDTNDNQIGRTLRLEGISSFNSYNLYGFIDDTSNSGPENVEFNFYGATKTLSNSALTFKALKRLPFVEFKIESSAYEGATGLMNPSGEVWFSFETDSYGDNGSYLNYRVSQINPKDTKVLEAELELSYQGKVSNDNKSVFDIDIAGDYTITIPDDNGVPDEEIKYMGVVDVTALTEQMQNAGYSGANLSSPSQGYILYSKRLKNSCRVYNGDTSTTYGSIADLIADHQYSSDSPHYVNQLLENRYFPGRVMAFSEGYDPADTSGYLSEIDLSDPSSSSVIDAGTWSIVEDVECINESDGSSITLDIIDIETDLKGYEYSDVGYKDGVKYYVEYNKAGDTYAIYFYNSSAIEELISEFNIPKPMKDKYINDVWTYFSLPSKMTLCRSDMLSALSDLNICNDEDTIDGVFGNVDTVLKYTGYWSYWEPNLSNDYNMDKFTTLSNKEGILIKISSPITLSVPYDIYAPIETELMDMSLTGWYLASSPISYTTSQMEDMVEDQSKTLRYMLNLEGSDWSVFAPFDNDRVDSALPRMDKIDQDQSFWIYVE